MPLIGGAVADTYGLTEVFYVIAAIMFAANFVVFLLPNSRTPA